MELTFATETTVTLCWCQQTAEANRGVKVVLKRDSLHSAARHETRISGWKGECEIKNNFQNVKERTQELNHSLLGTERKPAQGSTLSLKYNTNFSFSNLTLRLPQFKPLTTGTAEVTCQHVLRARPVVDLLWRQTAARRSHCCDNCTVVVYCSFSPPRLQNEEKIC